MTTNQSPTNPPARTADKATRDFGILAARLASDLKCEDVVLLDLMGKSPVAELILIATGTSDRQMKSVIEDIAELGADIDFPILRKSEDDRATWIVADFGPFVAHIFEPNTRAFYDLELLWGDSEHIAWQRDNKDDKAAQ